MSSWKKWTSGKGCGIFLFCYPGCLLEYAMFAAKSETKQNLEMLNEFQESFLEVKTVYCSNIETTPKETEKRPHKLPKDKQKYVSTSYSREYMLQTKSIIICFFCSDL